MMKSINGNGRLITFDTPKIMGILNTTPDSFYDGGTLNSVEDTARRITKMVEEGVDIIDIGGMSTRPRAEFISHEDEWLRIESALRITRKLFPDILISVDTIYSETVRKSMDYDINIINDITGGTHDPAMVMTGVLNHLPIVVMHKSGDIHNLHDRPHYENVTIAVYKYFNDKIMMYKEAGMHDIIIDPGFGFSKSIDENFKLHSDLSTFRLLEKPLLLGISRKSHIYKPLGITAEESLSATTALHLQALSNGADILRVHDIKEAVQCISLYQKLN